jgi:hypothetical protein
MAGPFLDPSIMLLDPQFTDRFDVVQRVQSVSNLGEVSTNDTITRNILGVVTPAKPADLKRRDDIQYGQRNIVIFTRALLNTAAVQLNTIPPTQRQPDLLLWSGDTFMIVQVLPWNHFGPGWVRVVATSVDRIDATVTR